MRVLKIILYTVTETIIIYFDLLFIYNLCFEFCTIDFVSSVTSDSDSHVR